MRIRRVEDAMRRIEESVRQLERTFDDDVDDETREACIWARRARLLEELLASNEPQ